MLRTGDFSTLAQLREPGTELPDTELPGTCNFCPESGANFH